MKTPADPPEPFRPGASRPGGFSSVLLWILFLLGLYVFSTGPVVRWQPELGEAIYWPLRPLAASPTFGPPLRAWIRLWGVPVPE